LVLAGNDSYCLASDVVSIAGASGYFVSIRAMKF
jgi:hypothetical protein